MKKSDTENKPNASPTSSGSPTNFEPSPEAQLESLANKVAWEQIQREAAARNRKVLQKPSSATGMLTPSELASLRANTKRASKDLEGRFEHLKKR